MANIKLFAGKTGELIKSAYEEDDVRLIKEMVSPDTTVAEFKVFLVTAAEVGLNPLRGEIFSIKYRNNPAAIIVGRDGYLKIAEAQEDYDGYEVEWIEPGEVVKCKVFRKTRNRPTVATARMAEDNAGQNQWKVRPLLMLEKVAISRAHKAAYPGKTAGVTDISYRPEEDERVLVDAEIQTPQNGPQSGLAETMGEAMHEALTSPAPAPSAKGATLARLINMGYHNDIADELLDALSDAAVDFDKVILMTDEDVELLIADVASANADPDALSDDAEDDYELTPPEEEGGEDE